MKGQISLPSPLDSCQAGTILYADTRPSLRPECPVVRAAARSSKILLPGLVSHCCGGGSPLAYAVASRAASQSKSVRLCEVRGKKVEFFVLPERVGRAAIASAGSPRPRCVGITRTGPGTAYNSTSGVSASGGRCRWHRKRSPPVRRAYTRSLRSHRGGRPPSTRRGRTQLPFRLSAPKMAVVRKGQHLPPTALNGHDVRQIIRHHRLAHTEKPDDPFACTRRCHLGMIVHQLPCERCVPHGGSGTSLDPYRKISPECLDCQRSIERRKFS